MTGYFVVEPCSTSNGFEITVKSTKIDLQSAAKAISSVGEVVGESPVVLLVKVDGYAISIYASGRMLVKNHRLDRKKADSLARKIVDALESGDALS